MNMLEIISAEELMRDYVPLPRPENAPPLTLSQIISMEPRVAGILATVKPCRSYRKWYNQYSDAKNKVSELVGWSAEQFDLRTCQAYDIVMDTVLDMLDGKKGGATNGD